MLSIDERVRALAALGDSLRTDLEQVKSGKNNTLNETIIAAQRANGWFARTFIIHSLEAWSELLTTESLEAWVSTYEFDDQAEPHTVGLVLAGNIPLVGMHDIVSVFIAGHKMRIKPSSQDVHLIGEVVQRLKRVDGVEDSTITIVPGKLDGFNAAIATGSGNASRYFEQYFGAYPSIIRKNRTSIAVLNGEESDAELEAFMDDVFLYFGLGCRNVTKVYLPENFSLDRLFKASLKYNHLLDNNKYINNFLYHKTLLTMQQKDVLENGLFMMVKSTDLHSPVSVLNYETYSSIELLNEAIEGQLDHLQCVVGKSNTEFGKAQKPGLSDYSDGVDTLRFLLSFALQRLPN